MDVSYFPIKENHNVKSLLDETHKELLVLFKKIVNLITKNNLKYLEELSQGKNYEWNGPARKIKEIDKFQKISSTYTEKRNDETHQSIPYKEIPSLH